MLRLYGIRHSPGPETLPYPRQEAIHIGLIGVTPSFGGLWELVVIRMLAEPERGVYVTVGFKHDTRMLLVAPAYP